MKTKFIRFPGLKTEICLSVLCELYRLGGASNTQQLLLPFTLASKLSSAGLILTRRGRTGGSMLPPDFPEKTIQDLVEAVEPDVLAKSDAACLLETALRRALRRIKIVDCFPESVLRESPLGESWRRIR